MITPPTPGQPRKLGPYHLIEEIGRGGGGIVHRARHERSGATAAVKRLATTDPAAAAAIRREIAALARIRHPGVVRILEHGTEDGAPWLATEFVAGTPLREHLRGLWDPGAFAAARPSQ